MKTLFPKQQESADFFLSALAKGLSTLDTSDVGTGKTVVAAYMAHTMRSTPVAIICPKAVIPSWERELAEFGVEPLFVLNYEKLRNGRTQWLTKRGKKVMTWHLPKGTLLMVDEVHKAGGPFTQNAQLVISAIQQGHQIHGMSATACEDPTEMRALGFMLRLHALNRKVGDLVSWHSWMTRTGCSQDPWGAWYLKKNNCLRGIHKAMYETSTRRLTPSDFPDSFKENRVFVEELNFANARKIMKAYADLGITPEIVQDYIENGTVGGSEHVLVNLLRARQLAESFKVADLIEISTDLIKAGNSVVLFVNFRETVDLLCKGLNCGRIDGGQSAIERQSVIDMFQADRTRCVVVNTAAGGTGISLHDIRGERPRVSLISPSFSAKNHLQVLGRIHRNGAQSDALQKILIASGTIEVDVMKAIERKTKNLNTLHDS